MPVKDGLNAEQVKQQEAVARKVEERRRWAEYQRTYERCFLIAEAVWTEKLDAAQAVQQRLAEEMRDRFVPGDTLHEIHVPLFTPRDRLQFLKEVTTNLMIGTERRNLTVTPELKREAHEAPEAASGANETDADAEAESLDAAGTRPDAEAAPEVARA